MTPYNLAHGLYKARQADHTTLADPGDAGTIKVSPTDLNVCVVTGGTTRTLQDATEVPVGVEVLVISQTSSITIEGVVLADGDSALYVVTLNSAGVHVWSIIANPDLAAAARGMEIMTVETAVDDTATVTAAQLLKRILDAVPTAAATFTLPTAALLVAAIPGAEVGDSFTFVITNNSAGANTITVAAGAGGTADGTLTVAQNVARIFLVTLTNVTSAAEAYTVYGLGA